MNEMNLLEEFCATVPPPGPDRLRPARAALLAAASTRAPRTTRTRKLAFGAVTTAAATAAALVLTLAAPFGGSSLTPPANAAVLLQRAAKAALDQPAAAAGQYIYTEVTGPASGPPSSGHGAPTTVMTVMRTWQSVNGLKQGVIESQGTCGLLDTEQAGELPGESAPQLSARGATSRAAMIAPASLPARSASCNATIGGTPTSPPASTYQGLETLPTDPGALLSYLAAHYRPMLFPGQTMSRAAREYEAIGDILENLGVLPGTLESAMFQALQQLPGMTVVQDVTDYAGRTGIATAWVNDSWEFELIFNPVTYQFMGEQEIALHGNRGHDAPGTRIWGMALLAARVTSTEPSVRTSAQYIPLLWQDFAAGLPAGS